MRRKEQFLIFVLLFTLFLSGLSVPAFGEGYSFEADFSTESIGEVFTRYLEKKQLNESKISIGWCDLESGDTWYFGADSFKEGGSTYKLPLSMLYADLIEEGTVSKEDRVGVRTVEKAIEDALVDSNNAAAQCLVDNLHLSGKDLRTALSRYCRCEDTLPNVYYRSNSFSPRFMIGTLQTLYENAEKYAELIGYMKRARVGEFLDLYAGETEVAQKYGSWEGALCCSGIVYAERPFLITVFTVGMGRGKTVIGELSAIALDYAEYLAEQDKIAEQAAAEEAEKMAEEAAAPLPEPAAESPSPTSLPEPKAEPVPAVSPVREEKSSALRWVLPGAGVTVILLCIQIKKKKQSPDGE